MESEKKTLEQIRTEQVWEAARTGDFEEMRRLIENTAANMQARDGEHGSALHCGVLSGNVDVVRYLVERVGLNPLSANCRGETPWDLARRENKREILDYLEQWFGCAYEETYHNPIRRGFFPDPSIVRVGEDYYMVNSTFIYFPCIPVSHSKDLIHWEIIGYGIAKPEWARLDGLNGGMGYWAPDISYSEGRFYITATLRMNDDMEKRRVQMVTSSDRPEGPYDEPVFLDDDGIDPSIFHDDDGRKYMLLNRGARIRELSADCKSFLSPATMLWYGDCKRKPEGPHLLKYNGWYYLFLAEGGTGMGHQITVARSRTLMGPYRPSPHNPILHQWDERALIQCCGHGKPVQLPDGRWYIVYLCLRMTGEGMRYGILGRETSLDPLTWTAEGWPLVNSGRGPSDQQRLPFGGTEAKGQSMPLRDGGLAPAEREGYPRWRGQEWMSPRPLSRERVRLGRGERDGYLELKGQEGDLNSKEFRGILVTRQDSFRLTAWCELKVPRLEEGQSLGMACYYDENSYIKFGLCRRDGMPGILLQEYVGDGYASQQFEPFEDGEMTVGEKVRLCMKADGLARTFSCMIPAAGPAGMEQKDDFAALAGKKGGSCWRVMACWQLENTSYLSSEGLKKGKRFTGATLGVYVQGDFWGEFSDWGKE